MGVRILLAQPCHQLSQLQHILGQPVSDRIVLDGPGADQHHHTEHVLDIVGTVRIPTLHDKPLLLLQVQRRYGML